MNFVINIWLKEVPENTIMFCKLILIVCLLQQPAAGLMAAITAVGDIKNYQLVTGSFQFLNLPVAYVLIKAGLPAYFVLVGAIFLEFINTSLVIWFAYKVARLPLRDFVINTLLKSYLSVIMAFFFALLLYYLLNEGIFRAVVVGITSTISLVFFARHIAFTFEENEKIKELFNSFLLRLKGFSLKKVNG